MTDEFWYLDATDLVDRLRRREVSAREVTQAFLDRIEAVNPLINAIVTLDPEGALWAAAEADPLCVARVSQAGAIRIGKTNVPELNPHGAMALCRWTVLVGSRRQPIARTDAHKPDPETLLLG